MNSLSDVRDDSGHLESLSFLQQNWGDASDDFKFSGFFPSFLAPIIDPSWMWTRGSKAPKAPFAKASQYALPAETADANRRRERGAKALEERLHARGGGDGGAADDVEVAGGAPHAPISSTVVIPTTATPH
ncbi:hypothetical protein TSOC_009163 [Tetrabaena socialis]|uniref:Uncharacterized protein n=1 Tax=Tetrabaena socialis TaxID=47790 RepID=A0A2J7ZWK6_9CHLO|nr:hypothetical protein TSOC_009163 [Tetrabaena socialis]|eukprot:PNH04639.1 hypothetical protein TSOC_009163 [Tetrabaena socialis]